MTKLPLHPEELRIGYFPVSKTGSFKVLVIVVIIVAAAVWYSSWEKGKSRKHEQES